jgi:hypothetical protein
MIYFLNQNDMNILKNKSIFDMLNRMNNHLNETLNSDVDYHLEDDLYLTIDEIFLGFEDGMLELNTIIQRFKFK